jgi:hypothetical protein
MSTTILYPADESNTSQHSIPFSKDETNLIIECLLFSSSVNIGADWQEDDFLKMLTLAKKIKKNINKIDLKNLMLYKEENYEDNWTEELCKEFGKDIQQEVELNKA